MQARVRSRGEQIRAFILDEVEAHARDIGRITAERFGITRQATNKHLQHLVEQRALVSEGNATRRAYRLYPQADWTRSFERKPGLAEDVVWRDHVLPEVRHLPDNVVDIWQHGFTEMLNNAIDHSDGAKITVHLTRTAKSTECWVIDDGVGIFRKIQSALGLLDERHAVLELAKGKLTTDPRNHTGEGIFFSSRMFDQFVIMSGGVHFSHDFGKDEDWILERSRPGSGTAVYMKLSNHTARTTTSVFRQFTSGDELAFSKTVVPVRLAQYGDDKLVSRSQAKRLLDRVDRFKTVILDFEDVASIGQAFADEIFRVFRLHHPQTELIPIHANGDVQQMIVRVQSSGLPGTPGA